MKKSELLGQLQHAYDRLQDALRIPLEQELSIDGAIQRFEFTFELTWKTLKAYLVPDLKLLFFPISASDLNYNPRNTQCIPVVIIFAFLDLGKNS